MSSSSFVIEKRRRSYDKVTLEKRRLLVQMVEDGNTIASVSKEIGIKYSTAKLIYKRYRETGTFYQSRRMKTQRRVRETQESSKPSESPALQRQVTAPSPVLIRPEPRMAMPVCDPVTPITPVSPFCFPSSMPFPNLWLYPFQMI